MTHDRSLQEIQKEWLGSLKSYLIGFTICLLLTGISFGLVVTKILTGHLLIYMLLGLALTQAIIQLVFFLHVAQEPKPHWEALLLCFTILILLTVLVGSLWIMNDLNHRMMPEMMQGMSHD
jgi:cytochrome o ubiquinol oxidase operon protein cyoD